jgi:hypothetical protein
VRSSICRVVLRGGLCVLAAVCVSLTIMWQYSLRVADTSALSDIPCAAPCWHSITPGTPGHSADEISGIIGLMPASGHIATSTTENGVLVYWFWKQWPWLRTGQNSILLVGDSVEIIHLRLDMRLTVGEVIEKWGQPDTINYFTAGVPENDYTLLNLFYPTRGIQFVARVQSPNDPILTPDSLVIEALYSRPAPSLEGWLGLQEYLTPYLDPWPGYGRLR